MVSCGFSPLTNRIRSDELKEKNMVSENNFFCLFVCLLEGRAVFTAHIASLLEVYSQVSSLMQSEQFLQLLSVSLQGTAGIWKPKG